MDWGGWEDFDYHGTEENYYRGEEDFYGGGRDFDYYGQWEMNLDISIRARRESGAKDKTTKTKRKPKAKEVIAESTERDLAREFKILDLEEVSTGIDRLKSDLDREHKGGTVAKPRLFELGCPYPPDALYVPFASGGRSSRRRGKGSYFVRGGLENLGMRKDRELARKLISDLGILEDVAKGAD